MKKFIKKERYNLLIVGAFPSPNNKVFGGVLTACTTLLNSCITDNFVVSTLDTTQISNPPPSLLIRIIFAVKRFILYLYKLIEKKPDCILIFTSSGLGLLEKGVMAWLGRLLGIAVVMFPRGGGLLNSYEKSFLTRTIANFSYGAPSKILCQGQGWQDFFHKKMSFSFDNLPIVKNWAATNDFIRVGEEREFFRVEPINFLFVGWVEKEKGLYELIDAFSCISAKYDTTLTIVGDGNETFALKKLVIERNIQAIVTFEGWLCNSQLINSYICADVFILPSWSEGLPNSMIEAMAAKLPVIVTNVGNIPFEITNRVNGLLINPRSHDELVSAMSILCEDNQLRKDLAEAAHLYASRNYSIDVAVKRITKALNSVINTK